MSAFWRPMLAVLWKDLMLEARSREVVAPMLLFALLVVVVFTFAVDPRPALVAAVAPGALWVSFTFAGILGLTRTFALEKEKGGMEGLMLTPVGRDVLYTGKLLGSFLFMLLAEAVMLPVFAALFNFPLLVPGFWVLLVLATLGFAAVGVIFSAMAVNTRAREIMLPVLFFPIAVPVIIAAVQATGSVVRGEGWSEYSRWIALTSVFDVVFLAVAATTFGFVLEE